MLVQKQLLKSVLLLLGEARREGGYSHYSHAKDSDTQSVSMSDNLGQKVDLTICCF